MNEYIFSMKSKSLLGQVALLTLVTALFVSPYLYIHGTNIVTHTYAFGSRQFWLALSPYADPKGAGDWFKYSPFFAWVYSPFAAMKNTHQAVSWGIFNMFCFWWGISIWFPWKNLSSKGMWLAFLFCSMEADGSFRYQQMNAALVGLSLVGLYWFKEEKWTLSGFILALVTNVKILPALFLLGLLYPLRKKYIWGIGLGLLVCLVVPIWVWEWKLTWLYHQDWYGLLRRDTQTDGILDVATVLKKLGLSQSKMWVLYPLAAFSGILFLGQRVVQKPFSWELWISLGLLTLLLVNPRTESPTFVLAAPTYLFLLQVILGKSGPEKITSLVFWSAGVFLITFCMNDLWPKVIWNPGSWLHFNKTLGVFILWLETALLILIPQRNA